MTTSLDEPIEFLGIAASKGFLNDNTVNARRTACKKFFDILDEDQKNVEYAREHLDVIKARFMNLNKEVAGATVDEYARRVQLVLNDFTAWKEDRSGWERAQAAKQTARPAGDGEKKAKPKAEKKGQPQEQAQSTPGATFSSNTAMRTVEVPLRKGVEAKLMIPREDFLMADAMKIAWAMLSYAADFDPEVSRREMFPLLGKRNDLHTQ